MNISNPGEQDPGPPALDRCARAWGEPACSAVTRFRPGDFVVEEVLGFEPDGDGLHTLLCIRKTGANTEWTARRLARAAGVAARDVGFCGMKDRHAVATQWFSLPGAPVLDPDRLAGAGIELLRRAAHGRKLRRGSHRGNRFRLRLRQLEGDLPDIERRLARIAHGGVPNYFGEQRFGRDGANLYLARALASGARLDRRKRAFALSAARSAIFNQVLSHRVEHGTWNRLCEGDLAILNGTGSRFLVDQVDEELQARTDRLDLHPSGPLWGDGDPPSAGDTLAMEQGVAGTCPELVRCLQGVRMGQDRRALRLPVGDIEWDISDQEMTLAFELPKGAFATAVLRELIGRKASVQDPDPNNT